MAFVPLIAALALMAPGEDPGVLITLSSKSADDDQAAAFAHTTLELRVRGGRYELWLDFYLHSDGHLKPGEQLAILDSCELMDEFGYWSPEWVRQPLVNTATGRDALLREGYSEPILLATAPFKNREPVRAQARWRVLDIAHSRSAWRKPLDDSFKFSGRSEFLIGDVQGITRTWTGPHGPVIFVQYQNMLAQDLYWPRHDESAKSTMARYSAGEGSHNVTLGTAGAVSSLGVSGNQKPGATMIERWRMPARSHRFYTIAHTSLFPESAAKQLSWHLVIETCMPRRQPCETLSWKSEVCRVVGNWEAGAPVTVTVSAALD